MQGVFNGDVSISFGLNQYSDQLFMAYKKPSTQQSIMIGFRIPIIDWGVQKNNNAIAKSRYESSLLEADNSEKKIYELLRSTVEDYNYSVRVIDIFKRQSELAFKQYKLTVRLFSGGHNTFFELATARNQYLDAERTYLEQLSKIWINYYKIRSLTLTEYGQ